MGPLVAVDVTPAPAADAVELVSLIGSCTQALPQGSCERASGLPLQTEPSAVARVIWSSDESSTVIEVRLETAADFFTRELSFSPGDQRIERWRTVGLTIATMVDELHERIAEAAAVLPPAPPAQPAAKAPRAAPPSSPPAVDRSTAVEPDSVHPPRDAVEAGALFGTGLASGEGRGGLYARAAHDVGALPAYADIGISYAVLASEGEPALTFVDAVLGGGFHGQVSSLRLELGLGGLLRYTHASAKDPLTGAPDSATSWLPGACLSARAAWPARGPLSAALGVQGSWVIRSLTVTNAGSEIGHVSAYSVALVGGLRLNWPE